MPSLIALLLILLASPLSAQSEGVVRGRVRSETTGEPLVAATVELRDGERARAAATGRDGSYLLRGVSAGRRLLRVSHLGHAPLEMEVLVPASGEVELDVALRLEPVVLEPVRVEAGGVRGGLDTLAAPAAELGLAGARALDIPPGIAELGLGDAAQGVPGQEPADPSDVLFVRGAAADLKLVYLDGAPVYAAFPLGGLLDAFSPDLLRAADVYLGGAPARFDGGLSYILDLRTRGVRSDAPHSTGAVDLLSSRAMLELPVGSRAGVLVAGRTVHGLGAAVPLPYGYREGLLRADARLGEHGSVSLTGFRNQEDVWLDSGGAADSTIRWGNSALSLRYRGTLAGEDAEITLALGDFDARLPLEGSQPVLAEGSSGRARLSGDFGHHSSWGQLRYGASFDRLEQSYRARWSDPSRGSRSTRTEAVGDAVGAYADLSWQAGMRLRLRGGLRADFFSLGSRTVLAPRLAATWLVTERAALTLAAGRYHQYVRAPEEALLQSVDAPVGLRSVEAMTVGSASHLAVSLNQDVGEGTRMGLEGYFKAYEGMPGATGTEANASGVDVWVRRSLGTWTGWAGYSLGWIWSLPDRDGANRFSGRHLLSSGLSAPLGERTRLDVRFAYGAGIPYAAIPLAAEGMDAPGMRVGDNSVTTLERASAGADAPPLLPTPDRPYLRLDLSASRSWSGEIWGSRVQLASYLKLLNTLGRRDALFYRFDREQDDRPRALGSLPVVPVLGVEWKF
jgi:hypothetical protein